MRVDCRYELTKTERRLYELLGDGELHLIKELLLAIDEFAQLSTLRMHMSNLRTKLKSRSLGTVISEEGGYRLAIYQKAPKLDEQQ